MGEIETPVRQRAADPRLSSIYGQYASSVRKRCRRLTGDATTADDLTQEVFTRFLARFETLPHDLNVHGYLLATAHNIWVNQLRKDGHLLVSDIDEDIAPDDRIENDPVRTLLLAEQRMDVQRGTADLPERQRRALALRELEDRSYAEIGAEMGMRTNAVAQVVWRARTQLRRSLRRSQVDVDLLPEECRARLDAMSDLVDRTSSSHTADLEAHMADCGECRRTLATYQEAGSRLRGLAPALPIIAVAARLGHALRAGVEMPLSLGSAAAVTAAVVATAGGGGALVASHYSAPSGSRSPAPRTLVGQAPQAALRATTLVNRSAVGQGRHASASMGSSVTRPRSHASRLVSLVVATRVVPARAPVKTALSPGSQIRPPKPVPANPPPTVATRPARTPDEDTKAKATQEAKTPPGLAKAPTEKTKTPPGQAKAPTEKTKTPPGHTSTPPAKTKTPGAKNAPPGRVRKALAAPTPGKAAHGKKDDVAPANATSAPASDSTAPVSEDTAEAASKSHGHAKVRPASSPGGQPAATPPSAPPAASEPADPAVPADATNAAANPSNPHSEKAVDAPPPSPPPSVSAAPPVAEPAALPPATVEASPPPAAPGDPHSNGKGHSGE